MKRGASAPDALSLCDLNGRISTSLERWISTPTEGKIQSSSSSRGAVLPLPPPLLSVRRNTISGHLSSIVVIQALSFIPRRAFAPRATPAVQLHPSLIDLLRFADSLAYDRPTDTIYSVVRGICRESRDRESPLAPIIGRLLTSVRC